nr:MarR family transcriptional regulator [Streptomyces sp. SID14478]
MAALAQGGAMSQKELARLARIEQPSMAQLLARMERDGLVERAPAPDDRRGSLISLTAVAGGTTPQPRAIACLPIGLWPTRPVT